MKNTTKADTIYYGGTIRTMAGEDYTVEAVAVKGETILACGSRDELEELSGPDTRKVDLNGAAMLPGFYDAHSHFAEAGVGLLNYVYLRCPPFGTVQTIEDCIDRLKAALPKLPPGKTLIGAGFDNCGIAERRHLNRWDLDRVSDKRPVIVDNYTSHSIYLNSEALRLMGITRDTPNPPGGMIDKDENGEPTGVLGEMAVLPVWELSLIHI